MVRRFLAIVGLVLGLLASGANAQEDAAPFGLKWMVSSAEIRALGVTLTPMSAGDYGISYTATNLPKGIVDVETVVLSFGFADQLWRVAALSRKFENDQYGISVRNRYSELSAALSKTYKLTGTYHQTSNDSYYGKPEKFSSALDSNEISWFTTYASPSADIELSIDASYVDDTYWRLIYSHRAGEIAFRSGKADAEEEAL